MHGRQGLLSGSRDACPNDSDEGALLPFGLRILKYIVSHLETLVGPK